jgi:hypothetical protein
MTDAHGKMLTTNDDHGGEEENEDDDPKNSLLTTTIEEQYRLLTKHNISLRMTKVDIKSRNTLLERLLAFHEQMGMASEISSKCGKVKKKTVLRVPQLTKPELHRLRYANQSSGFVDSFFKCLINHPPGEGADHNDNDVEAGAALVAHYLAKYHTNAFLQYIDVAQKQVGHVKKWVKRKPFEGAPPDLIMYDGGSREKAHDVAWNIRYRELMQFHSTHGHCLVPQSRSGRNLSLEFHPLRNWVQTMREYKRKQNKALTVKRIELLNAIGFCWELERRGGGDGWYSAVDDERYIKAVAARLFFQPEGLTSRDAMLLTGFSPEEASIDNRKKLVNHRVRNFAKKDFQIKPAVTKLLAVLQETIRTPPLGVNAEGGGGGGGEGNKSPYAMLSALEQFFGGPSETLSQLIMEGKLIPRGEEEHDSHARRGNGGEDELDGSSEDESEDVDNGEKEDEQDENGRLGEEHGLDNRRNLVKKRPRVDSHQASSSATTTTTTSNPRNGPHPQQHHPQNGYSNHNNNAGSGEIRYYPTSAETDSVADNTTINDHHKSKKARKR